MYLTSDNALAQAGLLIGPQKIRRIEPKGDDALLEMDDWHGAVQRLPTAAAQAYAAHREDIHRFFERPVPPRDRFYA